MIVVVVLLPVLYAPLGAVWQLWWDSMNQTLGVYTLSLRFRRPWRMLWHRSLLRSRQLGASARPHYSHSPMALTAHRLRSTLHSTTPTWNTATGRQSFPMMCGIMCTATTATFLLDDACEQNAHGGYPKSPVNQPSQYTATDTAPQRTRYGYSATKLLHPCQCVPGPPPPVASRSKLGPRA